MHDPNAGQNVSGAKRNAWKAVAERSGRTRSGKNFLSSSPPLPTGQGVSTGTTTVEIDESLNTPPVTRTRSARVRRFDNSELLNAQSLILEADAYQVELEEARTVLSMLGASRFVETSMAQSSLDSAIERVARGETIENYQAARNDLKAVRPRAEHAASMVEATVRLEMQVGQALSEAERELADLEKFAFIDAKAVRDKVVPARETFDAAESYQHLETAQNTLKGVDKDIANARSAAKKSFEQLDGYKTDRTTANDRLAEAERLRGAQSDKRVQDEVKKLRDAITSADTSVSQATKSDQIAAVRKRVLVDTNKALTAAKKQSEAVRKDFDEAIKSMPGYIAAYREAQDARDKIATMSGATTPLQKIDALLVTTRSGPDGGPPAAGYTSALSALTSQTKVLLGEAEKASQLYLDRTIDPAVTLAYKQANAKLKPLEAVAPVYLIRMHESELKDALALSLQKKDEALLQIQTISDAIESEKNDATEARSTAEGLVSQVKAEILKLTNLKAPAETYAAESKILERVEKDFLPAREYEEASRLLTGCLESARDCVDFFQANGLTWKKEAAYIQTTKASLEKLKKWPAVMVQASNLLGELIEAEAEIKSSLDYGAGITWLKDFKSRFSNLEDSLDVPEGEDLPNFLNDRSAEDDRVRNAASLARKSLNVLENALGDARNKQVTAAHVKYNACMADWEKFWSNPVPEGSDKTALASLKKRAETTIVNLQSAAEMAKAILGDDSMLEDAKSTAKEADAKADDAARPARVLGMIDALETLGGDGKTHRAALKQYNEARFSDPGARKQHLTDLEAAVQKGLDGRKQDLDTLKEEAAKVIKEFDTDKKKLQGKNKDFLAYFAELGDRLEDAKGLLEADDYDLVVNACKQIKAVGQELDAVRPDEKGKSAFKPVDDRITALSNALGADNKVRHYMKVSYNIVYAELQDVTAEVRKLPPEKGIERLDALKIKVDALIAETNQIENRYKTFTARVEKIEETGKTIAKQTRTRVTDRCDAYYAKFQTMLSEAKTEAQTEDHMDEAFAQLDAIEAELKAILDAPDSRGTLQAMDAKARQEQRLVYDLATRWKTRIAQFLDAELPRTKTEMLKRVKEGKAQAADLAQLDDLKGTASRADKTVESFTAVISLYPIEKLTANLSPPMDKALTAFGQANTMLNAAMMAARRLAGDPEGTNIKIGGDLKKIEANWITRARNFEAAFDEVIGEIKSASKDEPEGTDRANALSAIDALGGFPQPVQVRCLRRLLPGDDQSHVSRERQAQGAREGLAGRPRLPPGVARPAPDRGDLGQGLVQPPPPVPARHARNRAEEGRA